MRQEIANPEGADGPAPLQLFWALEDKEGEVAVQYDLDTGEERKIPTAKPHDWASIAWVPFRDPDLVNRINYEQNKLQNPTYVDLSPLPFIQIIPKAGELSRVTRRGYLEYFSYYQCSACDTTFKWKKEDDDIVPVCPNCGMTNTWACDIHGEVSPIHLENGENRCPHCEKTGIPRGCRKIRNLVQKDGVSQRRHYVAVIEDKIEIEIGDDRIIIRSL